MDIEYHVKPDGTPIAHDPAAEKIILDHHEERLTIRIKDGKITNAARLPLGLLQAVRGKLQDQAPDSMPCKHQL